MSPSDLILYTDLVTAQFIVYCIQNLSKCIVMNNQSTSIKNVHVTARTNRFTRRYGTFKAYRLCEVKINIWAKWNSFFRPSYVGASSPAHVRKSVPHLAACARRGASWKRRATAYMPPRIVCCAAWGCIVLKSSGTVRKEEGIHCLKYRGIYFCADLFRLG